MYGSAANRSGPQRCAGSGGVGTFWCLWVRMSSFMSRLHLVPNRMVRLSSHSCRLGGKEVSGSCLAAAGAAWAVEATHHAECLVEPLLHACYMGQLMLLYLLIEHGLLHTPCSASARQEYGCEPRPGATQQAKLASAAQTTPAAVAKLPGQYCMGDIDDRLLHPGRHGASDALPLVCRALLLRGTAGPSATLCSTLRRS